MYAHTGARLAYLAHPRTASMATGHALEHQAGFERVGGHHEGLERGLDRLDADPDRWTSVTTVRHHWDTVVSWHCGGSGPPGPLGCRRVREIMGQVTGAYVPDPHRLWGLHGGTDELLRYERLEDDLNDLLGAFGLGPVELPERNVTTGRKGRPYRDFYTRASRYLVEGLFYGEIRDLGYAY